jgi:hypothetical protein
MTDNIKPIGIYYEHPDWFRPLFAELDKRGIPYKKIDASCHGYTPGKTESQFSLVFNRMSASAYTRGHGNTTFYTRNYLAHFERRGVRVINGGEAFDIEISKALQLELFDQLGLAHPRTRIINCAKQATEAARELSFPIVVKPNIGGRGAGVILFDSADALSGAVEAGLLELGIDSTLLVQEFVPKRGGHITRVETLGGKYLYGMNVYASGENFNLCPAEICQVDGVSVAGEVCIADASKSGLVIEPFEPPREAVEAVERIVAAAKIDVGGIEYMVDDRDGTRLFYDINTLSNFVADAPRILGFDPHERLVDFLEQEVERCAMATGSPSSVAG